MVRQFEGAGLDGVVAKALAKPYAPNGRTMLKVKHSRTADVVVAGYRLHKTSTPERPLLGSMLLGLYADDGQLQHVGVCASFTEARRAELIAELEPLIGRVRRAPVGRVAGRGGPGWLAAARRPESLVRHQGPLVRDPCAEAGRRGGLRAHGGLGDGARFRHTAQFKRWRADREPESCTYEQLEEVAKYDLSDVFSRALPTGERRDAVVGISVMGCFGLGLERLATVLRGECLRHEGVAALGDRRVERAVLSGGAHEVPGVDGELRDLPVGRPFVG